MVADQGGTGIELHVCLQSVCVACVPYAGEVLDCAVRDHASMLAPSGPPPTHRLPMTEWHRVPTQKKGQANGWRKALPRRQCWGCQRLERIPQQFHQMPPSAGLMSDVGPAMAFVVP